MSVAPDSEHAQLRRELDRLRAENARLSRLLNLRGQDTTPASEQLAAPPAMVTMASSVEDKLALYADLFRARTDVYGCIGRTSGRAGTGGCLLWRASGTAPAGRWFSR